MLRGDENTIESRCLVEEELLIVLRAQLDGTDITIVGAVAILGTTRFLKEYSENQLTYWRRKHRWRGTSAQTFPSNIVSKRETHNHFRTALLAREPGLPKEAFTPRRFCEGVEDAPRLGRSGSSDRGRSG